MHLVKLCAKSDWKEAKSYLDRYTLPSHALTDTFGVSDWAAIHYASSSSPPSKDSIIVLESLLGHKDQDPNARTSSGSTPLHLASWYGSLEVVSLLLTNAADPRALTASNRSPVHFACRKGNQEILRLLLQFGASVNVIDKRGMTPLHLASDAGSISCIEILKEFGADSSIQDNFGRTAYNLAVKAGRLSDKNPGKLDASIVLYLEEAERRTLTTENNSIGETDQRCNDPGSSLDSFVSVLPPSTIPFHEIGPVQLADAISTYVARGLPCQDVTSISSFVHKAIESRNLKGADLLKSSETPESIVRKLMLDKEDSEEMHQTTRVALRHGLLAFISEARAVEKTSMEQNSGWPDSMFRKEVVVAVGAGLLFSIIVPFTRK